MAASMTVETDSDVDAFIERVANAEQREDARTLVKLLGRLSGHAPKMWGPTMIGFGTYHYRYDSGREGDAMRIGFSPRKPETVIYVLGYPGQEAQLTRLGKHKVGKSCLYIKRLSDVDMGVLGEICAASLADMDERYPR